MKIAGVMTGTSCDGLDIACVQFKGDSWKDLWSYSTSYPTALRKRVLDAQLPGAKLSLREWGELHRDIGAWVGKTVVKAMRNRVRPDAIASHGQTVAHFPAARKMGFTIQLGDPTRIAEATGLTTISNFRDGDMASGGEGAPLAPRFHQLLTKGQRGIAIHNLGGISNLTYIGKETIAFDTGPANLWIDAAAEIVTHGKRKFDRAGALAARAEPDWEAVGKILRDPFFRKAPPKSTGRDDFPFSKLLDITPHRDDRLVATATAIAAESICRAYRDFIVKKRIPLETIFFSGGGAKNKFLLSVIQAGLPDVRITTLENEQYIEARAFAYFGYLALQGKALGGSWTGGAPDAPSAHIIPGKNSPRIVRQLAR